jgi:hypothetical protein
MTDLTELLRAARRIGLELVGLALILTFPLWGLPYVFGLSAWMAASYYKLGRAALEVKP